MHALNDTNGGHASSKIWVSFSMLLLKGMNMRRMFWPKEIWGKYGRVLEDFKDPANSAAAVQCLNHLVLNVMR